MSGSNSNSLISQTDTTIPVDYIHEHNSLIPFSIDNIHFQKIINTINEKHGIEQILAISARKDHLSTINPKEFIELIEIIDHNHHTFTENRLIHKLCRNLNHETVMGLLNTLHLEYSQHLSDDKEFAFMKKVDGIKKQLNIMYHKGLLTHRLILGLYLILTHENDVIKENPEITASTLSKYSTGGFKEKITNEMFGTDTIETFWEGVFTKTTEVKGNTTKNTQGNLIHTLS